MKKLLAILLRRLAFQLSPPDLESYVVELRTGMPPRVDLKFRSGERIIGHVDAPYRRVIMHKNPIIEAPNNCPDRGQNIAGLIEHFCDERTPELDGSGVEFGRNCLTPTHCRGLNQCNGTCKLF